MRSLFTSFFIILLAIIIQCSLSIQYVDDKTEDDDKSSYKVADYIGVYIAYQIS